MSRSTTTTLFLIAWMVSVGGCGHDAGTKRAQRKPVRRVAEIHPAQPAPEMQLQSELGVVETVDVEEVLEGHFDEIRSCYQRAGKAQKYAAGTVTLRFLIAGSGQCDDVLVVESNLGNYGVERCLVDVGRRITFKAPTGNKATTFDYPVEFRSTQEMAVLNLDGPKLERDLSELMPRIAACGQLASDHVTAIMYIEPNGFPGSVGLAGASNLDEGVAGCIIQKIRRSKMSTVLPGRVLRCNFNIPPLLASAEPASRHAASSVVGHKRHR